MTATLTPAPLDTSQALVTPDSASQYCLSRHSSACAAWAMKRPGPRQQAARTSTSRADAAARSGGAARAVKCRSRSSEAQGDAVKKVLLTGGGSGRPSAGELPQPFQDAPPDEPAGS